MGKIGVLTKIWRIFQSFWGIDSTQSGMESGIFSPAYHTKFHSRTKIPLCIFTYLYVLPNRGARFARQHHIGGTLWLRTMMLPMVIKLMPKLKMKASPMMNRTQMTFPDNHTWGLYWFLKQNGRLWREHHGWLTACLLRPFQWWVFVPQMMLFCFINVWSYSCIYTDEAYIESWKKMAVSDKSIMWSAHYGFSSGEFLCPPKQRWKTCEKDSLFVCLTCVSTPKGTIVEVYIDSW